MALDFSFDDEIAKSLQDLKKLYDKVEAGGTTLDRQHLKAAMIAANHVAEMSQKPRAKRPESFARIGQRLKYTPKSGKWNTAAERAAGKHPYRDTNFDRGDRTALAAFIYYAVVDGTIEDDDWNNGIG